MNFYVLDNKEMDAAFLSYQDVRCKAAVALSMLDALQPGHALVVQLSNGAKYKGVIIAFDYQLYGAIAEGDLLIRRHKKSPS